MHNPFGGLYSPGQEIDLARERRLHISFFLSRRRRFDAYCPVPKWEVRLQESCIETKASLCLWVTPVQILLCMSLCRNAA